MDLDAAEVYQVYTLVLLHAIQRLEAGVFGLAKPPWLAFHFHYGARHLQRMQRSVFQVKSEH